MAEKDLNKKIERIDAQLRRIRLPRGEGSISWARKETCLLQYKKTITFDDGTTKRLSVTGHDIDSVRNDMVVKEREERDVWENTLTIKADSKYSDIILEEALERWFYKFKYINVKSRSFDREESTMKNQIIKFNSLSKLQMHVVNDIKIQDHLTMIASKYSYSTVKKTYELLDQFFRYYYSNEPNNNPMNTVIKPTRRVVENISERPTKEIKFFDEKEIEIFTKECVATWSTGKPKYRFGCGLAFLLFTGLRVGEALSLKWNSVDIENRYVYVRDEITHKKERDINMRQTGKTVRYVGDTKTKAGVRNVYLLKQAIVYYDLLKQQINPKSDDEFIFASERNDMPICQRTLYGTFNLVCRNCSIIKQEEFIGLHVLRHTFISMLCRKGVDKMLIASIVGQADTKMIERVYYHITQDEEDNAMKRIEQAMFEL